MPRLIGPDFIGIQVADLNALNALLAVIEWKRYLGYYATYETPAEVLYGLYLGDIKNVAA